MSPGVDAGDRPHEGRELARDGGGHRVGVLAAREQSPVAPTEADLGAPGDVAHGFGELLLPSLDLLGDLGPVAIGLTRLNQDSARVAVAALGDTAEPAPVTARVLARGEAEIAHELAWVVEAGEVAELGNGRDGHRELDAAECLQGFDHRIEVPRPGARAQFGLEAL